MRNCFVETSAPNFMPIGMRNMLATEWSKPIATKEEMGNQIARNFPVKSVAALLMYTARQTSQLQRTPFKNAARKGMEVLTPAMPTAAATEGPVTEVVAMASQTMAREPMKLPM